MKQQTIQQSVSLQGIGLHTGQFTTITFHPAAENHGYKFKRIDLSNQPTVSADVSKVVATTRCTTIKQGEAQVQTIEHCLSALRGLGIDNVLIEIDGPEVPILDGSAMPFVTAFEKVGIQEQKAERSYFIIREPIHYKDEKSGAEFWALPADDLEIVCSIDFELTHIGQQSATLKRLNQYKTNIAACRTFVSVNDILPLLEQGLIKGGSLDNALVIANLDTNSEILDQLAEKLDKDNIQINSHGVLNTTQPKFANEPARHKILDIIGDITLLGKPIKGKIIATKPGHTSNVAFTKILKQKYLEQKKLQNKPIYNPNQKPLYDTVEIMGMLPHRYPFLLVDKIIELSDKQVVGVKNITFNEGFFQGHFPNNPVFPGVLQIEAMAQTGGILALSMQEDPSNWDTYFVKMDAIKFRQKVVPGDTLIIKMTLTAPIKRGMVQMDGIAYVGNNIVSEGKLVAQIVKRTDT